MKKYGLLMTPDLAQKAYDEAKTVTRRPMKPQPPETHETWCDCEVCQDRRADPKSYGRVYPEWRWYHHTPITDDPSCEPFMARPRLRPGMIVSIKEYHYRWGHKGKNTAGNWCFIADVSRSIPKNLSNVAFHKPHCVEHNPQTLGWHGISGLFLPFDLARTHVEILDVRPEQVQEITGTEARLEGVTFDAIRQILAKYDSADVRPHHWIHNHPNGAAESYCDQCIDRAVAKARKEFPKEHKEFPIERDGGYDSQESEGVQCCETCGKLVEYTLLEGGVREEIAHFEDYGFDISKPREAHELERIFAEADYIEDVNLKDRVYRIGFGVLWDSINRKHPWRSKPWVWRYQYKRVAKPETE